MAEYIAGIHGHERIRHFPICCVEVIQVDRKRGNRKLICSGCGRKSTEAHDSNEREVRDLPWGEYRTTVIIEVYRVCCPQCGVKVEKVPQLPSKAPFSKRFEEAVGLACGSSRPVNEIRNSDHIGEITWSQAALIVT